jgi:hypothetical protein
MGERRGTGAILRERGAAAAVVFSLYVWEESETLNL